MGLSTLIETLRENKVDESEIQEIIAAQQGMNQRAEDANGLPEIQPANVLTVELFLRVYKYWHRVGMDATPMHLDPSWVETRAKKLAWYKKLSDNALERLWEGLDIMENECLAVFREQRAN